MLKLRLLTFLTTFEQIHIFYVLFFTDGTRKSNIFPVPGVAIRSLRSPALNDALNYHHLKVARNVHNGLFNTYSIQWLPCIYGYIEEIQLVSSEKSKRHTYSCSQVTLCVMFNYSRTYVPDLTASGSH